MLCKEVVLYGNDQGANNVLDSIQQVVEQDIEWNVTRIPGLNLPVSDDDFRSLCDSDVIVLGISSGAQAGMEARLARKVLEKVPRLSGKILFVEDFPGSSGVKDPDMQQLASHAHLGSIMELCRKAEERVMYRSVHTLGPPAHWQEAMWNMEQGKVLRANGAMFKCRRGTRHHVRIDNNDVVVYLSGFQQPAEERSAIIRLLSMELPSGKNMVVHFRPHPGELNRPKLREAILQRDELFRNHWEIVSPEVVQFGASNTDARLIGFADVTVAHPGATANFYAAATRTPMVCVMEFVDANHTSSYDYRLTGRNTELVERVAELPAVITELADPFSPRSISLRDKQAQSMGAYDPATTSAYGQNAVKILQQLL